MKERLTLKSAETYWLGKADDVRAQAKTENPWVFVSIAVLIDCLSGLVEGRRVGRTDYVRFIRDWMAKVSPEYRSFRYRNRRRDLPEQMYFVLRCGMVHSLSFLPDAQERVGGARIRSVVLNHQSSGNKHLSLFVHRKSRGSAAVLVAEDLSRDLYDVTTLLFQEARKNKALQHAILRRMKDKPPIGIIAGTIP